MEKGTDIQKSVSEVLDISEFKKNKFKYKHTALFLLPKYFESKNIFKIVLVGTEIVRWISFIISTLFLTLIVISAITDPNWAIIENTFPILFFSLFSWVLLNEDFQIALSSFTNLEKRFKTKLEKLLETKNPDSIADNFKLVAKAMVWALPGICFILYLYLPTNFQDVRIEDVTGFMFIHILIGMMLPGIYKILYTSKINYLIKETPKELKNIINELIREQLL
jgi:hypothetical protein